MGSGGRSGSIYLVLFRRECISVLFLFYTTKERDMGGEKVGVSDFGSVRNIRTKSAILMVSG